MSKELKIGVFAVTILIVSYFLINYLRGEDIFNNEIELSSRYENVEGLLPSAPVYIKGYKAGKVSEVLYVPETGDFKVTCSIDKDFMIPTDSRMTIHVCLTIFTDKLHCGFFVCHAKDNRAAASVVETDKFLADAIISA